MSKSTKSWDEYWVAPLPQTPVVDEAADPMPTRLYDANGRQLYRQPNPVGFETDPSRRFRK